MIRTGPVAIAQRAGKNLWRMYHTKNIEGIDHAHI